ncbi:hypothetical protein [Pantoea anthophila]|uniref:hypothetical protein n=1 Tax=Pantoea anthophila TaxID=470931 RepID=UPI003CEE3F04
MFAVTSNLAGMAAYYYRYKLAPGINFVEHLDGLGAALASYATAMMALVFALIVILMSLNSAYIQRFRAEGYLKGAYIFYLICFVQLGATLFLSILCLSNIKTLYIASLAMTFSVITFIQVF